MTWRCRYGIVVTTIHDGKFIEAYEENFRRYDRLKDVRMYVVGDRKTPPMCRGRALAATRRGFDCQYFGVEEQKEFLRDYPRFDAIVPWDSDNRRNVGFILALRDGLEVVISIDDDNFPLVDEDFIDGHCVVGTSTTGPAYHTPTGWFNLFEVLEYAPSVPVWPRGYPYWARVSEGSEKTEETALIHVNTGLWKGDPDVDSITRIAIRPTVRRVKCSRGLLARFTYSPINSQNTAVWRGAMPAYYYIPMHHEMHGSRINRFGDIWSGFFASKCAKTLGYGVSFGRPIVRQDRNPHDLFVDLNQEYWGIVLTEQISRWLQSVELSGESYATLYGELADRLLSHIRLVEDPVVNGKVLEYFRGINAAMHEWLETVRKVV